MSWKDIIKAPYDYPSRTQAEEDVRQAKRRLKEHDPVEDVSTDVSRFASKYLDEQTTFMFARAFVNKEGSERELVKWREFTNLLRKYGKDGLEKELGKLYNTKVFITHRDVGTEFEDYVIDLGKNRER